MFPSDAASALLPALHRRLADDPALTVRLGGARVFDHVPRNAPASYVAVGEMAMRDRSTSTEAGAEARLSVLVVSEANGRREALEIAALVDAALGRVPFVLPSLRLVSLGSLGADAPRGRPGDAGRITLRFRAFVEPG